MTPNARFGFHSALEITMEGDAYYSPEGTAEIWETYPAVIRRMLRARGWNGHSPHPDLIWLTYNDLRGVSQTCG